MRHYLPLNALMIFALSPSLHSEELTSMIELKVNCPREASCRYTGEMIPVELELLNSGQASMAVPLDYLQARGPKITLVDNHSGKEYKVKRGPPQTHLVDQLQSLEPNQSFRISWLLVPGDINRFALRPIDITVKFAFDLTPRVPMPETQFVTTQLHIVDGRLGD